MAHILGNASIKKLRACLQTEVGGGGSELCRYMSAKKYVFLLTPSLSCLRPHQNVGYGKYLVFSFNSFNNYTKRSPIVTDDEGPFI